MLTSLFRKSTPFNYTLVILASVVVFFIELMRVSSKNSPGFIMAVGSCALFLLSLFTVNFIFKKNGLSRDSGFAVLFFLLFSLFFSQIFIDFRLLAANFFILLAMRRLLSLTSMKATREKIFDASLWIFVAALFHFWSIAYILLVFISIFFHVSNDYRNWTIPFLAFFCVVLLYLFYYFAIDPLALTTLQFRAQIKLDFSGNAWCALKKGVWFYGGFMVFFLLSLLITISRRPQQLHSAYKKCVAWLFVGLLVFWLSDDKPSQLLIFTLAPLSMLATSFVEFYFQSKIKASLILYLTLAAALFIFIVGL